MYTGSSTNGLVHILILKIYLQPQPYPIFRVFFIIPFSSYSYYCSLSDWVATAALILSRFGKLHFLYYKASIVS